MLKTHKYTLLGIAAIVLWSCLIALLRNVSEQLGPVGGAAMVYSISAILLMLVFGVPKFKAFPLGYLVIGGVLFAAYESFFSLALGFANDRVQTIEMGVVNYLWPSFTVLFSVLINKRVNNNTGLKSKIKRGLVYPSLCVSFFGVAWSILGEDGLSITTLSANVASNPIAYSFALSGAIIWGIYCNVTKYMANGKNAITLFFMFTAIVLWVEYSFSDEPPVELSMSSVFSLLLASGVMASGYALWNSAIIGGNMVLLATLSYFTPILSSFISMLILGVALSNTFWQGVVFVTIGSLMCWWATREESKSLVNRHQATD